MLIAEHLGWLEERIPWDRKEGLSDQEKRQLCRSLNGHRRHASAGERRAAIKALLIEAPEKSNRAIAEEAGVSHHTVQSVRDESESTGQIAQLNEHLGKDQKARSTAKKPGKTTAAQLDGMSNEREKGAQAEPPGPAPLLDGLGLEVPAPLRPVFAALGQFQEANALLRQLGRLINDIGKGPAGGQFRKNLRYTECGTSKRWRLPEVDNALARVKFDQPYASLCPYCERAGGKVAKTCKVCLGQGWVTEAAWDSTPEDYRQTALRRRRSI
jgi:hypothetical protein